MIRSAVSAGTRPAPDGFIVVAVLWILGALATLASIYAVYVVNTASAFGVHDDRLKAEGSVKAGLELTAYQLTAAPEARPTRGSFAFRLGTATVRVEFSSEAARIDLNNAEKDLLSGLFISFGTRPDQAREYADRIIGWRTTPPEGQDAEASAYRMAGLRYAPRGGHFPHTGELWLVHGLPPALIERALPLVTVYSGLAQINVADAAPEVLAALPGITPSLLHTILVQRQAPPQNRQALLAMLGPAQTHATVEGSKATRVRVRVEFENGRQMNSEVVILVFEGGEEPYKVLSWRDELDEPPPDAGPRTTVR